MRVTNLIRKPTQENRILDLLQGRGERGAKVFEFMAPRPDGLGIAQYNARIFSLRRKGYVIENKTPGHFILVSEPTKNIEIHYEQNGQGCFI